MKNILFIVLSVFLIMETFCQSNDKSFYATAQVAMLMGSRQISELTPSLSVTRFEMQVAPSITLTAGHIFNEHWAAGAGAGFEMFDHHQFPVFADVRYTLWNAGASPFFALKTGYSFGNFKKKEYDHLNLAHDPYHVTGVQFRNYGGWMLHPEMGVKLPLGEKADVLFTVAYRFQRSKSTIYRSDGMLYDEWKQKGSIYRLSFGIAAMFR